MEYGTMIGFSLTASGTPVYFPDPSGMTFGYQDISDSESGRDTITGKMYKGKIGCCRTIGITWSKNMTRSNVKGILEALKNEYLYLTFYDPEKGASDKAQFYCGDRSTAVRTWVSGKERYTQIQVEFVERTPY